MDKNKSKFEAIIEALTGGLNYVGESGKDFNASLELQIPFLSQLMAKIETDPRYSKESGEERVRRLQKEIENSPIASRLGAMAGYAGGGIPKAMIQTFLNVYDKSKANNPSDKTALKDASLSSAESGVTDLISRQALKGFPVGALLTGGYGLSQSDNPILDALMGVGGSVASKGAKTAFPEVGSNKSKGLAVRQLGLKKVKSDSPIYKDLEKGSDSPLFEVAKTKGGSIKRFERLQELLNEANKKERGIVAEADAKGSQITRQRREEALALWRDMDAREREAFRQSEQARKLADADKYLEDLKAYEIKRDEFDKNNPLSDFEERQRLYESDFEEAKKNLPNYDKATADYQSWKDEYFASNKKPEYKVMTEKWQEAYNAFKASKPKITRAEDKAWKEANPKPKYLDALQEWKIRQAEFNAEFPKPKKSEFAKQEKEALKALEAQYSTPPMNEYTNKKNVFDKENPRPEMSEFVQKQYKSPPVPSVDAPNEVKQEAIRRKVLDAIRNPREVRESDPSFQMTERNLSDLQTFEDEGRNPFINYERVNPDISKSDTYSLEELQRIKTGADPAKTGGRVAKQIIGNELGGRVSSILGEDVGSQYQDTLHKESALIQAKPHLFNKTGLPEDGIGEMNPLLRTGGNATSAVNAATGDSVLGKLGLTAIINKFPEVNQSYITPLRLQGGEKFGGLMSEIDQSAPRALTQGMINEQNLNDTSDTLSEEEFNALSPEERIQLMQMLGGL